MSIDDITILRLQAQRINQCEFTRPAEAARWLCALQAQDYAAAKWAIGLRTNGITDKDVEQAFNNGQILRTHLMRPTWHFVTPEDIGWLLELTAPKVKAQCAHMNRKMELNETIFKRCNKIIAKALKGGQYLTRPSLGAVLQKAGIAVNDLRLTYIVLRAELDAVICSGPRRGKQFTYALLAERAPGSKTLIKSEAIAELARRYFTSHGPATLQDFVWWSGVAAVDARSGVESVKPTLQKEIIEGKTYWYAQQVSPSKAPTQSTYLLPNFDEYIIAYKDRTAVFNPDKFNKLAPGGNVIFNHAIITDGKIMGTWKRELLKNKVLIEPLIFIKQSKAQKESVEKAARNYAAFLGLNAEVNW